MVLDGVHLRSPVFAANDGGVNLEDGVEGALFRDLKGEVGGDEFFVGDIHELVEVEFVLLLWAFIECLDVEVVVVEDGESVPVLVGLRVLSAVLNLPVSEQVIDLWVNG